MQRKEVNVWLHDGDCGESREPSGKSTRCCETKVQVPLQVEHRIAPETAVIRHRVQEAGGVAKICLEP